jgi:hypothetical protein
MIDDVSDAPDKTNTDHEVHAAEEQLAEDLLLIFRDVRLLPRDLIKTIDYHELAEDGETLVIGATTAAGVTMTISLCVGGPVVVRLHDH